VQYERDAVTGQVSAEISHPSSAQHCLRKEFGYDTFGNLNRTTIKSCSAPYAVSSGTSVIAPRNQTATFSATNTATPAGQNPAGIYPSQQANALGHTEQLQHHNAFGGPVRQVDADGLVSTTVYDVFGRKTSHTRPDGNKTQWTYGYCGSNAQLGTSAGQTIVAIDCPAGAALRISELPTNAAGAANGAETRTFLDPQGRTIQAQVRQYASPGVYQWASVRTGYDNLGRVVSKSEPFFASNAVTPIDPIFNTTFTYDSLGRVTQQAKPSPYAPGGVATHTTVYQGRITQATNPRGHTQTREKDEYERTIRLSDAQGNQQSYQFDAWGNLHQTQNPLGFTTRIDYDISGHKARMSDPDMGLWAYQHNPLGELRVQTNPKGQTATMVYDSLGRMTGRSEPDLVSNWSYDKTPTGASCGPTTSATTKGELCEASTTSGYKRTNKFDTLNRIVQSSTTLDAGSAYVSKIVYNTDGRISQQIWPTGLAASNLYDATGTLVEMRLAPSNQSLWKRGTNNARGQFTQVAYGNTIQTRNTYEPQTGLQTASQAGPASSPSDASIINHSYPSYNALGHLVQRNDANHATQEQFSYDNLNRLTTQNLTTAPGSTPASLRSVNTSYNALGNILTHSDVGQYTYGTGNSPGVSGNGPHTLLSINGQAGKVNQPRYSYDQHGNITQVTSAAVNGSVPSATRTHSWTSFDNPLALTQNYRNTATNSLDTSQVTFLYGSDHQRIREVSSQTIAGVATQKTLAILHPDNAGALYFERETINTGVGAGTANATQNRHYLSAEKGAFLLITSNTSLLANPTPTTLANAEQRYWHKDHLGSIAASTNANLTVIERLAYEPFGKRRFANGQYDQSGSIDAQSTNRGFTGHEHLDSLDFIHMNARVYDPDIGRFLSPDPTVPYAHNPQSFNRFAYTQNNPLNRVDPDGFADWELFSYLSGLGEKTAMQGKAIDSKAPQAKTPSHEAITANNPSTDDNSGQSFSQAAERAFTETGKSMLGITDANKALAAASEGKFGQAAIHGAMSLTEAGMTAGSILAAAPTMGASLVARTSVAAARTALTTKSATTFRAPTNVSVYSVIAEVNVVGATRATHRANANKQFHQQLVADPAHAALMNTFFSVDVKAFMETGVRGFRNPPNTNWHHPVTNKETVQLLDKGMHKDAARQPAMHPDNKGGFADFFSKP
jgi:RHS repeat-associated protein